MNTAETIQAAIEKLIAERDHSLYQGDWSPVDHNNGFNYGISNEDDGTFLWLEDTDARDLIVTLHRTIDAQLVILRDARKVLSDEAYVAEFGEFIGSSFRHELILARAILGESS